MRGRLLAVLIDLASAGLDFLTVGALAAGDQEHECSQREYGDDDEDRCHWWGLLPSEEAIPGPTRPHSGRPATAVRATPAATSSSARTGTRAPGRAARGSPSRRA